MARGSKPKRRGWYPHRYEDEGMQSYWDGSEWTGQSRPNPSLLAGSAASTDRGGKGALGWVLLAIGLGVVGSLVSQSEATALRWFLAAAATAAWVLAAMKARSTIGRVILWIVVAVQAVGWVILLLLVGSGTSVSGTSDAPPDPTIEFLVPGCTGGALEDCLMLYFVTDVGSTTEQVALTCGNRVEPSLTSCAAMVKQSPDGYRPLVDQCDKGFYLACDTLPLVVPVDSAEGRLAATCGGLREPDLITPCTLDFGNGARE